MRDSTFARLACALVVLFAIQVSNSNPCGAAFLSVYGGPTYSQTTGGYLATDIYFGFNNAPLFNTFLYGAVNDAGVAVGNVDRADSPLTSTLMNVYPSVATWSATSSPVILDAGSSATMAQAFAINEAGTVVGMTVTGLNYQRSLSTTSSTGGGSEVTSAARWSTPNSNLTTLAPGTTNTNVAFAINSQGVSVGASNSAAARWDATGTPETLGAAGGGPFGQNLSRAWAINSSGVVVGQANINGNASLTQAVRWNSSGTPTLLGDFGPHSATFFAGSVALSINSAGTAVGYYADTEAQTSKAIRWDASGTNPTELGNLGVNASGTTEAYAVAINDSGTIIGNALLSGKQFAAEAVRWDPSSTTAVQLGTLAMPTSSFTPQSSAIALNSNGIIIGSAQNASGANHAVYWNPDGSIVDLNSLIDPNSGWTLTNATAVSDTGWVLGVGFFDPDGPGGQAAYQRLFLIQVPEPSSLLLLAFGIIALAYKGRAKPSMPPRG